MASPHRGLVAHTVDQHRLTLLGKSKSQPQFDWTRNLEEAGFVIHDRRAEHYRLRGLRRYAFWPADRPGRIPDETGGLRLQDPAHLNHLLCAGLQRSL